MKQIVADIHQIEAPRFRNFLHYLMVTLISSYSFRLSPAQVDPSGLSMHPYI